MEVYILTGKTITQHDAETRAVPPRYDAAKIALDFADRQDLYDRIDRRVDAMVRQGLFDEVRALLAAGVPADCTAMQAIGYKEAVAAVRARHRRRTPSPPSSSPPGAMPSASSRGCGAIRTCSGSGTKKRRTWTGRAAFRRNSYPAAV